MKKQTATEAKAKHSSPTKRKWNSKVADLLVKTLDRHEAAGNEEKEEAGGKHLATFAAVEALLSQTESLIAMSEVESLIEEARMLNIPTHNDNINKLQELKVLSADLEKEAEKLSDKKSDRKIVRYYSLLKRVVDTGVAITNLHPVVQFLERNITLLQGLQEGGTLASLVSLLEEAEKTPKLYDAELLESLGKKKDKHRKALSKSEELLKVPQVCLIIESDLQRLVKELSDQKMDFEEKSKVFALSDLVKLIRELVRIVFTKPGTEPIINELDQDALVNDEELSDVLQRGTFRLKDMLDENISASVVRMLEERAEKVKVLMHKIGLEDPELYSFLGKLDAVVWRHRAKEVLNKNEENEDELVKLLQDTPKDIVAEGCKEYSQIKERVHAIQAAQSNEKRIVDKLDQYWEDDHLHLKIPEIRAFVEETKSYILKKKIERKLEVLEQVALALQNVSSAKNKEDLVDEMSDLRLQGTKVFQKLSAIAKASEKAEKQVAWIRLNKKKLQKYRESALSPSVRVLIDMPRMKLSQAKEIHTFLKGLPSALRTEYDEDIKALDSELHTLHQVSQEAETLLKQFPRQKFLDAKYTSEEARGCMDRLRSIVKKLFDTNYKDETIESKLSELDLLVKSASLLDRSIDPTLKRDISSWESTHKALKEWSKDDQKNGLMKAIVLKLKKAEKIMMEVHRMRQYESQFAQAGSKQITTKLLTRQNKMPTVEEAKALLASYEEGCQEIELEDTSNYLRSLVRGCEERIAHATSHSSSIGDLVTLLEQLKKTPLNVEALTTELNERVGKGHEFVKKVKGLTPEALSSEMGQLRDEYTKLGVKVPDFERLSEQFFAEKEKCRQADDRLERLPLQDLMRIRQEIMGHSFFRDRPLETKMLLRQVQMLEDEFVKSGDGFDDEIDTPIVDLVTLETLQKELLEVRKNVRFNYSNKGQFLGKLISEVKSYLQEHIYSLDLDGMSRLRSKCYKKLLDLTKEITDHKIKLEISQKPQERPKKQVEETRKYDVFGLFGSDFAHASRVDQQARKQEIKPYNPMDLEEGSGVAGKEAGKATVITSNQETEAQEGGKKERDREQRKKRIEGPFQDPKKPEVGNGSINSPLREYFGNTFKYWLEKNENFEISGLDALMAAKTLEKHINDKYIDKAKEYDEVCESVSKVLRNLVTMKHLSTYIRNKGYRLSILLRLTDKDRSEIRKIDTVARQKLDKNKGKPEDAEIRVVDEEDELLDNIGESKPREEANLHFSDFESDGDNQAEEVFVQKAPAKPIRALCYDPETGQYQLAKNKFVGTTTGPSYSFYNIFKGGLVFDTIEKQDPKKKPERAKLFSCFGEEFIRYFTEIPEGLQLQPTLSRFEFEQYMQKVLVSDQALTYLVLPLWVEAATPLTIKNFYKSSEVVGSAQYSARCKLFVFPKEYLRHEWLNVINFYFVKKDLSLNELLGFIVLKLVSSDTYEVSIIPEPVPVEKTHRAYKFARSHNDVVEKMMDIDTLRENKRSEETETPPKESARFFEDIVDNMGGQSNDKNQRKKPASKLQKLMNNELSTTQSPRRSRDPNQESNPEYPNQMRIGRNQQGMQQINRKDDMNESEALSRFSSADEADDQFLGKRSMAGRKGPDQTMQSQQIGNDYQRGYKPQQQRPLQQPQQQQPHRGAPGGIQGKLNDQRMDRGLPSQYGQTNQSGVGMPNKVVKRDFRDIQSTARPNTSGQSKPSQFYTSGAMSNFDMSTMGDLEPLGFGMGNQINQGLGRPQGQPQPIQSGGGYQQRSSGPSGGNMYQGGSGNYHSNQQGQGSYMGSGHQSMNRQGPSNSGAQQFPPRDSNQSHRQDRGGGDRQMRGGGGGYGGNKYGGDRGNNMGGAGNRYQGNSQGNSHQGQPQHSMGYHPGGGQRGSYQPQIDMGSGYGQNQFGGNQGGYQGNRMAGGNKPMGGNYQPMGQGGHRQGNDYME